MRRAALTELGVFGVLFQFVVLVDLRPEAAQAYLVLLYVFVQLLVLRLLGLFLVHKQVNVRDLSVFGDAHLKLLILDKHSRLLQ